MSTNSDLRRLGAGFSLILCAASMLAQQPTAPAPSGAQVPSTQQPAALPIPSPNEPALTLRDQSKLESFEPAVNEEYTLGAGDEITLDFPGHPDMLAHRTIGPDGRITLPLSGGIKIAELTREEAEKAVVNSLSKYFTDLAVTVSVDKYSSNRVRVLGYVQHPGEITFEETPTLLDAIGRAGLIQPQAISNGVSTSIGPGIPETCTIYRGNSTAVQVQLREMLMTGNRLADLRLRRNDIVYVPEPHQMFVSVLGNVTKPGTIALTKESTLTSILAEAGCCADPAGFNPEIHILQPSTQKDFKVKYKQVMTLSGQQEFTLHSGDVIIVPTSGFGKVSTIIQKLSPAATMISMAALIGAGL